MFTFLLYALLALFTLGALAVGNVALYVAMPDDPAAPLPQRMRLASMHMTALVRTVLRAVVTFIGRYNRRTFKLAFAAGFLLVALDANATLKLSQATREAMAAAITSQIDAGTAGVIQICSNAQVACSADTNGGCDAGTLLATLTMSSTSATSTTNGVITFAAITDDSSADATGTAQSFMVLTQTGGTCVYTGTVGTSGQDLNLNTTSIVLGARVSITSATITMPNS